MSLKKVALCGLFLYAVSSAYLDFVEKDSGTDGSILRAPAPASSKLRPGMEQGTMSPAGRSGPPERTDSTPLIDSLSSQNLPQPQVVSVPKEVSVSEIVDVQQSVPTEGTVIQEWSQLAEDEVFEPFIDEAFIPYLRWIEDRFHRDHLEIELDLDEIRFSTEEEDYDGDFDERAGVCLQLKRKDEIVQSSIIINYLLWPKMTELERLSILLHELGHCHFSLPHLNEIAYIGNRAVFAIMHERLQRLVPGRDDQVFDLLVQEYIDFLFP